MEKPLAAANAGESGCSGGTAFSSRASSQRGGTRPGAFVLGMVRNALPGAAFGAGKGKKILPASWRRWRCSQRLMSLDTENLRDGHGFCPELGVDPHTQPALAFPGTR